MEATYETKEIPAISSMLVGDDDLGDIKSNPLWPLLVETTRRNPLYPGLASYLQAHILPEKPDITPRELAGRLAISLGEALVLLDAARSGKT